MQAALKSSRGFTLLEMVMAIVILGIIGATIGMFIVPAVNAHQAMERRAELVDSAEIALRRMARDIRLALPNSLAITSNAAGFTIELVPTVDGGRYCNGEPDCNDSLSIGAADNVFDILGCFHNSAFTASPGSGYRLVVGDSTGAVYSGSNVITPSGTTISLSIWPGTGATPTVCGSASAVATPNSYNRHRVTLSAAHAFPSTSPRQRVYVVKTAVAYVCNMAAGTLTRYDGYAIGSAPSGAALVTNKVATVNGCSVTSTTGNVQAKGLITLKLALANAGETVSLMEQVQLDNSQ
jgi:MSHA biogenesis protein MshO